MSHPHEVQVNRTRLGRIIRARLLDYFELFLTTVGVIMAVLLMFAELSRGQQGIAFISLVWLQGFLLWAVHRHAWFQRRALVDKLRVMLQDRVNNQLTIMLGAAETKGLGLPREEEQDLDTALLAARTVSHELENLSLESLRVWERRYGGGTGALIS